MQQQLHGIRRDQIGDSMQVAQLRRSTRACFDTCCNTTSRLASQSAAMKTMTLTSIGNEVDLRSGKSSYVVIFNESFRIEISEKAAKELLAEVHSDSKRQNDYSRPPIHETQEYVGKGEADEDDDLSLHDAPASVYDEDTGVEQV